METYTPEPVVPAKTRAIRAEWELRAIEEEIEALASATEPADLDRVRRLHKEKVSAEQAFEEALAEEARESGNPRNFKGSSEQPETRL